MTLTPIRSVRISQELWNLATEKATNEGTTVSAVIVKMLKEYTK